MRLQQYVPLLTSSTEEDELPAGVRSAIETLRPIVVKHGRMGTLSLLVGGYTVLKGLAALRSNRTRALRQLAVGAGWIAIGRAQQQASDAEVEVSEPWTSDEDENEDGPEEEEPGVIAEENTESPRDFGDPETGETPEDPAQGAGEEAEITGPTEGDAVPENSKEGGSEGHPADDVEMVDDDADAINEGSLQTDEQEEDVAAEGPDDGETVDENEGDTGVIAESNQQPPIAQIDDEEVESGDVSETETTVQESKAAGPDAGDAVPENSKEGGSEGHPADNVGMIDDDADEVNEGSLQTDEQEEEVASDADDEE